MDPGRQLLVIDGLLYRTELVEHWTAVAAQLSHIGLALLDFYFLLQRVLDLVEL